MGRSAAANMYSQPVDKHYDLREVASELQEVVLLTGEEGELSYRRWYYSLGKRGS